MSREDEYHIHTNLDVNVEIKIISPVPLRFPIIMQIQIHCFDNDNRGRQAGH